MICHTYQIIFDVKDYSEEAIDYRQLIEGFKQILIGTLANNVLPEFEIKLISSKIQDFDATGKECINPDALEGR